MSAEAPPQEYSAGFSTMTVADARGEEHIRAAVWYPTRAREARVPEQQRLFSVARDAMPAPGSYPIVLLSHGSGGWYGAHHDTAEHLARCGFVVVAVTHPGDNYWDLSGYLGAAQLTGRPRHLALALEHVLGMHKYSAVSDRERIGAMGFAEGAYAVVLLLGGVPDFEHFVRHAAQCPEDPVLLPHWELTLATISEDELETLHRRIGSAVLMAPCFGFLFDRDRLSGVRARVRLYRAGMDRRLKLDAHWRTYLRDLPIVPEYRVAKGAGHYAFVAPCPEALIESDPDVCRDRQGFNRHAFHLRLNEEIRDYFDRTLAGSGTLSDNDPGLEDGQEG